MEIIGLEDDVRRIALEVLTDAANATMADLVNAAPVDTGELRDSAYGPEINEEGLSATVGFTAPQADFTDQGVQPHEIRGVNGHLSFFWANGPNGPGQYTFDSVQHPGQAGSDWFTGVIDDWQSYVDDAAATA